MKLSQRNSNKNAGPRHVMGIWNLYFPSPPFVNWEMLLTTFVIFLLGLTSRALLRCWIIDYLLLLCALCSALSHIMWNLVHNCMKCIKLLFIIIYFILFKHLSYWSNKKSWIENMPFPKIIWFKNFPDGIRDEIWDNI